MRKILPTPVKSILRDGHTLWCLLARKKILPRSKNDCVRDAISSLRNELKAERISRASLPVITSLKGKQNLKLNLGCGRDIRQDWINIDLSLHENNPSFVTDSSSGFLNWDLRLGLPLEAESSKLIYSSHFIEHLDWKQGLELMRECYRVLQVGGVFRVSLPNFRELFRAYLDSDQAYFDLINIEQLFPEIDSNTRTIIDYINYGVYQYGEHKCVYDQEKVQKVLKGIGFKSVLGASFQLGMDPDTELRRRYSFYVEAIK